MLKGNIYKGIIASKKNEKNKLGEKKIFNTNTDITSFFTYN